jgi:hypothetical protein
LYHENMTLLINSIPGGGNPVGFESDLKRKVSYD